MTTSEQIRASRRDDRHYRVARQNLEMALECCSAGQVSATHWCGPDEPKAPTTGTCILKHGG
jgi:hypothetical protein